jgi:hypothetical protein
VIEDFLRSKEAGVRTELKASTLERAAQSLYTAIGKDCPVRIFETQGQVYLINRAICDGTDNSTSTA